MTIIESLKWIELWARFHLLNELEFSISSEFATFESQFSGSQSGVPRTLHNSEVASSGVILEEEDIKKSIHTLAIDLYQADRNIESNTPFPTHISQNYNSPVHTAHPNNYSKLLRRSFFRKGDRRRCIGCRRLRGEW